MWILKSNNGISDETIHLLADRVYTVGRKGADVILSNDSSISRQHCTLKVVQNENGSALNVSDSSKYGTFYCSGASDESSSAFVKIIGEQLLQNGDSLRVGVLKSIFKVVRQPIIVAVSKLDSNSQQTLTQHVKKLNGSLVRSLTKETTHLVMNEIVLNVKVIQALACNCPIVTMDFFRHLVNAIESKSPTLPSLHDFIPNIAEERLNTTECSFKQDDNRVNMFKNKVFVFLSKKQFKRLLETCICAGATAILANDPKFKMQMVTDPNTIVVGCPSDQESQVLSGQKYEQLQNNLVKGDLRFVQEYEIGLALLYCSLEVYCNPAFDLPADGSMTSASLPEAHSEVAHTSGCTLEKPETSQNMFVSRVPESIFEETESATLDDSKIVNKINRKRPYKSPEKAKHSESKVDTKLDAIDVDLLDMKDSTRKPKPPPKKKRVSDVSSLIIDEVVSPPAAKISKPDVPTITVIDESDEDDAEVLEDLPDSCIADDSLWSSSVPVEEHDDKTSPKRIEEHEDKSSPKRTEKVAPKIHSRTSKKAGTHSTVFMASASSSNKTGMKEVKADKNLVTEIPPTPLQVSSQSQMASVKIEPAEDTEQTSPISQTEWVDMESLQGTKQEATSTESELFLKDTTKVIFVSLVVGGNKKKKQTQNVSTGLKNFKRFRKVLPTYYSSGSQTNTAQSIEPPKIIGGRDLFEHKNRIKTDMGLDNWVHHESQESVQDSQDFNPFKTQKK